MKTKVKYALLSVLFVVICLGMVFGAKFAVEKVRTKAEGIYIQDENIDGQSGQNETYGLYAYDMQFVQITEWDIYGYFGANRYWQNYKLYFSQDDITYDEDIGNIEPSIGHYALMRATRQAGTQSNAVLSYIDYMIDLTGNIDIDRDFAVYENKIGGSILPNGNQATDLSRVQYKIRCTSYDLQPFTNYTNEYTITAFANEQYNASLDINDGYAVGIKIDGGDGNYILIYDTVNGSNTAMPYQIMFYNGSIYAKNGTTQSQVVRVARDYYNFANYMTYGAERYTNGYNAGYENGLNTAENGTFYDLISAVVGAPVGVVKDFLSFEILGVNMLAFFSGIITLMIIVKILKMII